MLLGDDAAILGGEDSMNDKKFARPAAFTIVVEKRRELAGKR